MKDFSMPSCISTDLKEFEKVFKKEITSSVSILNIVTSYVLKTKGKQLRPILVFLSARMFGNTTKSTYSAAYMIELMHTATLIHDDVVDNSEKRRGFFSINALWKNKIAVLVGDFFLSKGLIYAIENKEFEILEIISKAVKQMSEGELLQIEKARKLSNTEEIYFEIIRKKTATLFVASMSAGAVSSKNANSQELEKIEKIAELLGLAFQIKDDLLDYTSTNIIGKPTWNDLKEQKMTLPLLHALSQANNSDKKHITKLLKTHKNKTSKLQEIVDFVIEKGGLQYTEAKMNSICEEAITICNTLPINEAQQSIIELITFVKQRVK